MRKPRFTRKGKRETSVNWATVFQYAGRPCEWSLGTPNKEAAAQKARDIYLSLIARGWEETIQAVRASKDGNNAFPSFPDWTFQQAWRYLREQKPRLFEPSEVQDTTRPSVAREQSIERKLAEKAAAARDKAGAQKQLAEKLAVIRAEHPGLSFTQAWAQLKRREPLLIAYCQVVEARL